MTPRIGVDLGGTKIEIAAFDDAGRTLVRRRVPTPASDYERIIGTIRELVVAAEAEIGERASVGIGTPGAVSRATGLIKNANSTVLIGKPLERDLTAALGREIRLANDANCFALSEAVDGAGAGLPCVFGVILGTGVGGGIVFDARPLSGHNAIAGEWGHNPLPWPQADELPGRVCYCGKRGCIETFLSGPAFARDHVARNGGALDAPTIAHEAAAGDVAAGFSLERYIDRLARALACVINLLDPDAIVLGGGVSNVAGLAERASQRLRDYVFSDVVSTPVRRAVHGDSSGVRGAAWLWPFVDK
ncbi:MAG: ROK family protein [Candidatus Eremiobacteraeota bacterium]|nr:ROK family protein [Candidatus Eremiobacteraeota bacterium]